MQFPPQISALSRSSVQLAKLRSRSGVGPSFLRQSFRRVSPFVGGKDFCDTVEGENGQVDHCCCEYHFGSSTPSCACLTIVPPIPSSDPPPLGSFKAASYQTQGV
jgi:hypothetical protein